MALLLAPAGSGAQAPAGSGYRIGPKDLISVRVFEVPELNVEIRVGENGEITLPLIGDVGVSGRTKDELEAHLKELLESKYVQRATVAVEIREYRSNPINVIGAVEEPGPLSLSGRWTLLEALTAAGGLTANHGDVIYVSRRASNGLSAQVEIPVEDLLVKVDPEVNIPIFANDLINVPETVDVTVFCLGEVGSPGALVFRSTERITLLAAIARAGGLSDRASKKIVIKRESAPGKTEDLVVDYKRILSGKEPDPRLESGDVIHVKQSFL